MATYEDADAWFTIGDGTRRAIVLALAERPKSVGEIAAGLPVSRPAVSQHLRVLKELDLVTEHAEGTRRVYQLNAAGLSALRDQLDTFWNRAISAYLDVVEDPRQENA